MSGRDRLTAWYRRWQQWKADAENPSPIKDLGDVVPPSGEALMFEEYGDVMDPQSRPEWPPAGPTSAYPEANEKKMGGDGGEEDDDGQ